MCGIPNEADPACGPEAPGNFGKLPDVRFRVFGRSQLSALLDGYRAEQDPVEVMFGHIVALALYGYMVRWCALIRAIRNSCDPCDNTLKCNCRLLDSGKST